MTARFRHIIFLYLPTILVLFSSCNLYKNVPPDDKLFNGSSITVTNGKMSKETKKAVLNIAKPEPNASIFGIKYRLILFNMIKPPKKQKGLFYKMKYKWGQAPVLLSQARPKLTDKRMQDYLFSVGYLQPEVEPEIKAKEKTATIDYKIAAGTHYTIDTVFLPQDSSVIAGLIRKASGKSLIRTGQYFNLNNFEAERDRIDIYLKQNGHFFFIPDYILFKIDSLHEGKANLYVTLKPDLPASATKVWTLGTITVYGNYTLERDSVITKQAGVKQGKYVIVDPRKLYKPELYNRTILLRSGQMYRRNAHSLSIERLMNLGTFRFVKVAFSPNPDSVKPILDTKIYLTPSKKKSLRIELSGNSKSNNFLGSELSVNFRNVNAFRGAEIFEAKIAGSYDFQVGGNQVSSTAYTVKASVNIFVPKMLVPFHIRANRNPYMPRTFFSPAIEYIQRPDLYTLRSISFSSGYNWKQGRTIEHTVRVLNINAIQPSDITPKFDSILQGDVSLKASFEKQLIIGSRYEFKFNNTFRTDHDFNYAFDGSVGSSGNLASLFVRVPVDTPNAKRIFNVPISQYIRFSADLRGYWKLNDNLMLANRITGGVAIAYGNSVIAPYSEQFFIGGSSSIRAFRARTLGPGSYHTDQQVYEANQSGEIKVELNSELRISLTKLIKFATFIDAGNIWLRKDAIDKPGSGFGRGALFRDMAVGYGMGLRFDASVLVIRFDLAMPIRKPWYPEKNKWVFNEIDFTNSTWRKENLVLNIGIGYPF